MGPVVYFTGPLPGPVFLFAPIFFALVEAKPPNPRFSIGSASSGEELK
jgi:hypothetical protein